MKVYAVMKHTGDGCSWEMEEVEQHYLCKDKAVWDMLELEENNKDKDTSFFIREYEVCEDEL